MSDRPSTMPLATISSINAPDTCENHLEILDTDDEEPKGVDRETSNSGYGFHFTESPSS